MNSTSIQSVSAYEAVDFGHRALETPTASLLTEHCRCEAGNSYRLALVEQLGHGYLSDDS